MRKCFNLFVIGIIIVSIAFTTFLSQNSLALQSQQQYVVLKCQFHTHTTFSDGKYSPEYVVELYKSKGYDCIAITDHNTMDGVERAKQKGNELGLIVIGGVEITERFPNSNGTPTHKHILALWVNSTFKKYPQIEVEKYFGDIHAQSGIGIIAHCWRKNEPEDFIPIELSPYWQYRNCSWIDGWEISLLQTKLTDDNIYNLIGRGYISLGNHDFHRNFVYNTYNLLFCHNKTEEGVKEALLSRRVVAVCNLKAHGSFESMELYRQYMRG